MFVFSPLLTTFSLCMVRCKVAVNGGWQLAMTFSIFSIWGGGAWSDATSKMIKKGSIQVETIWKQNCKAILQKAISVTLMKRHGSERMNFPFVEGYLCPCCIHAGVVLFSIGYRNICDMECWSSQNNVYIWFCELWGERLGVCCEMQSTMKSLLSDLGFSFSHLLLTLPSETFGHRLILECQYGSRYLTNNHLRSSASDISKTIFESIPEDAGSNLH